MTAAAAAAVGVGPAWPGPGRRSAGSGEIMKGHLATQVNALIQSEKEPAGEAFYEREVEGDEEPAVTAAIISCTAHFGGSQSQTHGGKTISVPQQQYCWNAYLMGSLPIIKSIGCYVFRQAARGDPQLDLRGFDLSSAPSRLWRFPPAPRSPQTGALIRALVNHITF